MFKVGEKVVCLARTFNRPFSENIPKRGGIYTVRSLESYPGGDIGIRLFEVRNSPQNYSTGFAEASFMASRFRPLTEDPKAVEETMRKHFNKFLKEGVSA